MSTKFDENVAVQHELVELLKQQITKNVPEFVRLEYTSEEGEVSQQLINVGIPYQTVIETSFNQLDSLDKSELYAEAASQSIDNSLIDQAIDTLRDSLSQSLNRAEQFSTDEVSNFEYLSNGIKMHRETKELYLSGLVRNKKVLVSGTYKETKSRPATLAKKIVEKKLNVSKYRMFKISPLQLHEVGSEGKTLIIS